MSVGIAVAVVYVAHRRGREIVAPAPAPEPQMSVFVPPSASRPARSTGAQVRLPRTMEQRNLRTLYGLQGPSTKAEPHLAKSLYEEVAKSAGMRRVPHSRDGAAP